VLTLQNGLGAVDRIREQVALAALAILPFTSMILLLVLRRRVRASAAS
jgi:hypothetical protein